MNDFKQFNAYLEKINLNLEKIFPRKFSKEFLEEIIGDTSYELDIEALNKVLTKPIWDLLDRGGKRWRPIFFLILLEALGKNPDDFLDFASLIELIHNGSLIVDDIEDSSDERRGARSIHLSYGVDIALNAGNFIYFYPLHILKKSKINLSKVQIFKIYQIYIDELIKLHLGQGTDIAWHNGLTEDLNEQKYLQMCIFKTGGLPRMAAKIAGVIANLEDNKIEDLGKIAETLGVVFQIQDDILNITKSKLSDNKGLGEDITEGKKSLPVIYALNNLKLDERKKLQDILKSKEKDKKVIKDAIKLIIKGKGIEESVKTMEKLYKDGSILLKIFFERRGELILKFIEFLKTRQI
ncbi:polyprenyl synthetase family protein [Candidatus Daviesbacteria bacterium]|nr:polyprenyl synthetase family protein [Candidatus Daviesbacteria bacterium]